MRAREAEEVGSRSINISSYLDGIDANVNHCGTSLQPVTLDHLSPPRGGNNNIGLLDRPYHRIHRRLAVHNSDGRIAFLEEHGHGRSHDIRPPNDDRVAVLNFRLRPAEELDAALREMIISNASK